MANKQTKRERKAKRANEHDVELLLANLEKLKCDQRTLSRDELQAAVKDLVEMVDGYLTFSAFEFVSCAGGQSESNLQFHYDWPNPQDWSIEPNLPVCHQRVERYQQLLDGALPGKQLTESLSDTVGEITAAERQAGFYVGILVGAKMTGASTKEMHQLGTRLFDVIYAQPRYCGHRLG